MKYNFYCVVTGSFFSLAACSGNYKPGEFLTTDQQDKLVLQISRYIDKKPKGIDYDKIFDASHDLWYKELSQIQESSLHCFFKRDSLNFYLIIKKDLTSLYNHYRYYGGNFKLSDSGKIVNLDQYVVSGRLGKGEVIIKGEEIFEELISIGNLDKYFGNAEYMEWPNSDVQYSVEEKKWVFTEGSRYKIFEEIKSLD